MKQLIKINNNELSFRLKLNYNNVYSRLKMLLGENASIFADISTKSTSTTWYSNDDAEYSKLSEAPETELPYISQVIEKKISQITKELKNSSELVPYADDIMEIPDLNFIFYRKRGDDYIFILTAWGCKFAHTTPNDSFNGIISRLPKQYKFNDSLDDTSSEDSADDIINDFGFHGGTIHDPGYTDTNKDGMLNDKEMSEKNTDGYGKNPSPKDEKFLNLQHVILRILDQNNNPVSGEAVNIITVNGHLYKESDNNGIIEIGNLPCSSQFIISFPNIKSINERSFEVERNVEMYDAHIKKLVKYSPVVFVEDQNGYTVQNRDIKIIIAGQETIYNTSEDGMIHLPAMLDGQKFIAIDTANYANTEEFDVTSVKAKSPYRFKIKRPEKMRVGITVLDASRKPISGATVNIEGNMPCEQITGTDGRAEFPYNVFVDGITPIGIKVKNKSKIIHELHFNHDVTEYAVQIKDKNNVDWKWLGILPLLALLGWGINELIDTTPTVDEMKSGVVLVLEQTSYAVDFGLDDISVDGNPCVAYFTYDANKGQVENVTFDPNIKRMPISTGTGFLISKDGLIATNKHVADPEIPQKMAEKLLRNYFQNQKDINQRRCDIINDSLNILGIKRIGNDKYLQLYGELKYRQGQTRIWDNILNTGNFEVKKETSLYVAFTGTNIDPELKSLEGFIGCNHLISGDNGDETSGNDVAIIQLRNKEKEIPTGAYIFNVPKKDIIEKEMPKNRRITLIGYNAGLSLQNLPKQDGLQPQIQSGELNNLSEKYRIGYDAGILGGSSGSPVFNDEGVLVAVNNSAVTGSNFSYGVRTKYLREILDKILNNNDNK